MSENYEGIRRNTLERLRFESTYGRVDHEDSTIDELSTTFMGTPVHVVFDGIHVMVLTDREYADWKNPDLAFVEGGIWDLCDDHLREEVSKRVAQVGACPCVEDGHTCGIENW